MSKLHTYIFRIVTLCSVAILFSCQDKLKQMRKWDEEMLTPQTVGKHINLFYTDSGYVKANLRSKVTHDFSQLEFAYREFPEGLEVDFFDDQGKKNTIKADYAMMYQNTNLVDLQGNVVVTTADSTILKAQQLYWDQTHSWVFSDIDYNIRLNNGALNDGKGFDANEKFDKFSSRSNVGVQIINEEPE